MYMYNIIHAIFICNNYYYHKIGARWPDENKQKKKGARGYGIASHSVCVCYVCWCITLKCDRWPSSLEGAPAAHAPLLSGAQRDPGKYRNERRKGRGSRGAETTLRERKENGNERRMTGGERGGGMGKGAIVIIFWGASLSLFSFFFFEQEENKGGRIIDKR